MIALDDKGGVLVETDGRNRVAFDFRCGIEGGANDGTIKIYHLSDSEETAIKRGATKILLLAGSDAENGEVFAGEPVDAFSVQSESSRYLHLSLIDGDAFFSSYISMSIGAGESLGGLVEKCAARCSAPLEIGFVSPSAYRVKLPRGAVLFGSPVDIIKSAARSLNAAFYVMKGRLYMIGAGDVPNGAEIRVDQESGLIGVPVVDHWYASFRHDVNSALSLGRPVSIDPETGGGHYRIVSIRGEGDTKEGEWGLSVLAIGQSGAGPNITAVTGNIWR